MKTPVIAPLFLFLTLPVFAASKLISAPEKPVPDQYLVLLRDVVRSPEVPATTQGLTVEAVATELGRRYDGKVLRIWNTLPGMLIQMPTGAAHRLADDPWVVSIEQDYRFAAFASPISDCGEFANCNPSEPGCPQPLIDMRMFRTSPQPINCTQVQAGECADNWGLDRIDQRNPRDTGSPEYRSEYAFWQTGADVKVYVIDGGVYSSHREFRVSESGGSRVETGYNATGLSTDTEDCFGHGHGTHVAGIIAGNSVGVAKNAKIVPVRYTNCNEDQGTAETRLSWLVSAFEWISDQQREVPVDARPTAVANLSSNDLPWRESAVLRQAVKSLTDAGVLLVQSASNVSAQTSPDVFVPVDACPYTLRHPEIDDRKLLIVGGSDGADGRWGRQSGEPTYDLICKSPNNGRHDCGSNIGRCLDLWAPAAHVVSASRENPAGYCRLSGTSMAAPHASGVAALFLETHRMASPESVKAALLAVATPEKLTGSIGDSPNLLLHSLFPDFGGAVAVDDRIFYTTGSSLSVPYDQLLANDFDWEGRPLSVAQATAPAHGTVTLTGNGFSYNSGTYAGSESFTYEVSNGNGTSTGTVTAINARPVAVADHFIIAFGQYPTLRITATDLLSNDFDVDGLTSSLRVASVGIPTFGSLQAVQPPPGQPVKEWDYDPFNQTGTARVIYWIEDGDQHVAEGTIYITTYNFQVGGLTFSSVGPDLAFTTQDTATLQLDLLANDRSLGADQTLTIVSTTVPAHGSLSMTGNKVTYTPNPGFAGYDSFTYVVRNSSSNLGAASVLVEVRPTPPGPVARPDFLQAERDTTLAIGYSGLLANDSGSGLTFRIDLFTSPAHGTLDFCCNAGAFKYNPSPGYVGPDSFRYAIQDNLGHPPVYATVSIDVVFINHLPVAGADSVVTEHDTEVTIPVLANDSDPDQDPLAVVSVTTPSIPPGGSVVINGGSTITFTPVPGSQGTANFTYTVQDGHNATATGNVTVRVRAQNVPPVAVNDPFSSPRNAPFTFTCGQLLANDSDSDAEPALGDHLTVTGVGPATAGTLVCTNCSCTLSPPIGLTGLISVPYTISDNRPNGTASAAVQVTVFNQPPVAVNDIASTPLNTPATINVRANDSDPDGDPITVDPIVSQPAAGTGTCAVASGGTGVVYTPPAGFQAQATCNYTVNDGLASSAAATITIYINKPPIARGDQLRIPYGLQAQIARATLLANDYDPDGNSLTIASFDTIGMAGALSCPTSSGFCTYTPPAGYYTAVTNFRYTATDSRNGFSTATVKLKVGVVQSLPVANDDLLSTTLNTPLPFSVLNVLANDTDADGDVLTAGIISGPRDYGTMNCSTPAYHCTYTPNSGFIGIDRFSYTVSDGADGSSTASMKMMVQPPWTPTFDAREDQLSTPQNMARFFTTGFLKANDYSPTGGPLTITSYDTTGLTGTLDCTSDPNACTYRPPSYFAGFTHFKYTVSDTHAHTDTATVRIKVGVNNAVPVAGNDNLIARGNTPLRFSVFDLLKNDVDAENDPLSVTVYPNASHGTVSCSVPSYWCTYTPAANYTGSDAFTYIVSDGIAYSNQATVAVSVQAVLLRDAQILSQSVPVSMSAGQSYPVSMTLKNVGTLAWSPIGPQCNAFRLGSVNPYDNSTWGTSRVELPAVVAPGGEVTLNFTVTSPSAPGTYSFQRRMVHECVAWFGDLSPNVAVVVSP